MKEWTAEITNNPDNDFNLCVELWENECHRGRIEMSSDKQLIMTIYCASDDVRIPLKWLKGIVEKASDEFADLDSAL